MNGWGLLILGVFVFLLGELGRSQGDEKAGIIVALIGGICMLVGVAWGIIDLVNGIS